MGFLEFLHQVRQEADLRATFPNLPRRALTTSESGKPGAVGLFFGRARTLLGTRDPRMGHEGDHGNPPDRALTDRAWGAGDPPEVNRAARRLVEERLCNQYHWHLTKCARYFRYYLLFQFAYVLIVLGAGLYASLVWRDFTMTAVSTLGGLGLLAFSEFMAYGTLSLRYYQLAHSLRRIHETYFGRDAQPGRLDAAAAAGVGEERRAIGELTDEVERTLSSEFRFWQLVHDTATTARDPRL